MYDFENTHEKVTESIKEDQEALWMRRDDRTNTNLVFMGIQGQGKSTALKSIAMSEYMTGTKIIFTDPDREYRELCHNLKGDWINAGSGVGGRINPLEIKPVPKDDEGEEVKLYVDNRQTEIDGGKRRQP